MQMADCAQPALLQTRSFNKQHNSTNNTYMPTSVFSDPDNSAVDEAAKQAGADEVHRIKVRIDQQEVKIQTPSLSRKDWRDQWISFFRVDRLNTPTPAAPPKHQPFDGD